MIRSLCRQYEEGEKTETRTGTFRRERKTSSTVEERSETSVRVPGDRSGRERDGALKRSNCGDRHERTLIFAGCGLS